MSSDLALEQMLPKCSSLHDVPPTGAFCRLAFPADCHQPLGLPGKPDGLSGYTGCAPTWPLEATREGCEQASERCSLPSLRAQHAPAQTVPLTWLGAVLNQWAMGVKDSPMLVFLALGVLVSEEAFNSTPETNITLCVH